MALTGTWRPKTQQVGCLVEPGITGGKCNDTRLAEHRNHGEVEIVERFTGRQTGFGEMSHDASAAALGNFQFGERGEEARGRPSLLVSTVGKLRPEPSNGRQPQFVQQQWQTGGVDLDRAHGRSHSCGEPSKAS